MKVLLFFLSASHVFSEIITNHIIFEEDFNRSDFSPAAKTLLANSNISLAKMAGPDGTDCIRVLYAGSANGSRGANVSLPLSQKTEKATLSFDVKFESGFQWVKGGKLHGLGPLLTISGGKPRNPEGWSARTVFLDQGYVGSYLYDQNTNKTYGITSRSKLKPLVINKWQNLTLEVSLNEPNKTNGFTRIFVDGKLEVETKNVEFRTFFSTSTLIHFFLFSTFHGGRTADFAPTNSEGSFTSVYALFDNFRVINGLH